MSHLYTLRSLKEGIRLLKGRDRSIVKLLSLAKEEVWKRGNEFGNNVGNDVDGLPQGRIEAFTERPLCRWTLQGRKLC